MFKNPDELHQLLEERRAAASQTRRLLVRSNTQYQCYYQGLQWFYTNYGPGTNQTATTGRRMTNWDPDSPALRATVNRMSKHIIRAAAATHPEDLYVDVFAPDSDSGIDSANTANVLERLSNCSVDNAGVLAQARDGQFARCVCGTWGIGYYIADEVREVDGQQIPDKRVRCFTFDPSRLILDPANPARTLSDHDEVIFEDVWTVHKLKRVFPQMKFDEERMATIGSIMSQEIQMNALSNGSLYQNYRKYSTTKGAIVTQTHVKDETGRFTTMFISVKGEKGEECVNFDDPYSPFGATGLPLFLLHGHRRPMSPWSMGEGHMTKDDQDRLNLLMTQYFRMLRDNGGFQWIFDKRLIPKGTSEEQFRASFSNRIANVIMVESRAEKGLMDPKLQQYPSPPQFLMDDADRFQGEMQQQAFRSPLNMGVGAKTHIPDATNARMLEEADQVFGIRVQEDKATYEEMLRVLTATNLRLFKEGNPGTLVALRNEGFDDGDFAALLGVDDYTLSGFALKVRESKIRYRSVQAKQQALSEAAQLQAVNGMQYRMALAEWDIPVTASDQQMQQELTRAIHGLLNGQPWQPLPLGEYGQVALTLLRRALWDRRAKNDPQVKMAIIEAIVMQEQAIAHEQALIQPTVPNSGQPQQDVVEGQQSATIGDILNELNTPSGSQAGQPVPAGA